MARDGSRPVSNVFALVGAITDGYITLVGESARCTGQFVSDLAKDVSSYTGGTEKLDESRDREEACGCEVTSSGSVDDCVDVIDAAVDSFHRSIDARRDDRPSTTKAKVVRKPASANAT